MKKINFRHEISDQYSVHWNGLKTCVQTFATVNGKEYKTDWKSVVSGETIWATKVSNEIDIRSMLRADGIDA